MFEISFAPSSSSANSASQYAIVSVSVAFSSPARRQVSSVHSTMKVEAPGMYW